MKRALLLVCMVLTLSGVLFAEEDSAEEPKKEFYLEAGATLVMPAVLNLAVGVWGVDYPVVSRLSGMYWGATRGIQFDVGWAFDTSGIFKQYFAAHVISTHLSSGSYFSGIGPCYGFNLSGFSLQVGLAFGSGESVENQILTTTRNPYSSPQLTGQLGYTVLW